MHKQTKILRIRRSIFVFHRAGLHYHLSHYDGLGFFWRHKLCGLLGYSRSIYSRRLEKFETPKASLEYFQ